MQANKKHNGQIEIHDLIGDAIANAVTRRELASSEEALLALSDEEAAAIAGGLAAYDSAESYKKKPDITIAGFKPIKPCIIVGLIAAPDLNIA
jgi:hypothetical protein